MRRDTARVHRSASAGGGKLDGRAGPVNLRARKRTRRVGLRPAARALALCGLVLVAASGCLRLSRPVGDVPPGEWTEHLGDAAHAAFINERVPATVRTAWDIDLGRGLEAAPIIHGDFILSAVSGGVIITADARNGQRYWTRRFNGPVAGQVLRTGSQVHFATQHRNGTLYALDLDRGRRLWSRRIGSPAVATPVFADSSIYFGTTRDVQAADVSDGSEIWRVRLTGPPAQPPVVFNDAVIVAVRDTLFHLGRADGARRARIQLPGEPSAPIGVRGDTLFIAMHPGVVAAYVDGGAREVWRHTLGALVVAAPVVTSDGVFVLTRAAELLRLDRYGARRVIALEGAATESLTITADGALIGTLDGRIVFVRRDGTIVWEERVDGSVRAPAAVRAGSVYVGTLNGRLVKLTAG